MTDEDIAGAAAVQLEGGIGALVAKYIALRDKIADEESAFKVKMQAKKSALERVEEIIKSHFDESGTDTLTVRGVGTAYKTTRSTTSVADWPMFFGFVQEQGAWGMLEHRANKTAVLEHLKEAGDLPPGVNLTQQVVVNIRRS